MSLRERNNTFKPISWGRAKNALRPILGAHFEETQRRVLQGTERVFVINDYSIALFRAEGYELVVGGFTGNLEECAPLIAIQAKSRGFKTIRAHITRRSELRFLRRLGLNFEMVHSQKCKALSCHEYVIRMELKK
ncbi:hypothetical protein ACB087_04135 [Vibrio sp. VNB-15]